MALVKIKAGVKPKSLVILAAIANVARDLPHDVTITSGNDSTHMRGSKHYVDAALDVRTKNFPSSASKQAFVAAVLRRLGKGYDGFVENEGKVNEHAHFEWDPS